MTAQTLSRSTLPWLRRESPVSVRMLAGVAALLCLGIVIAVAPLSAAVPLLGGAAVVLLVFLRPVVGLCLLALILPFSQARQVSVVGAQVGVAEVLLALALASWLLQMASRRAIILPHVPLLVPFLAFLGIQALSFSGSRSLSQGIPEMLKWLEMMILCLCMASLARRSHILWVIGAMLAAGSAQALLGAYQFVRQIGPDAFVLMGRYMRAYGSFGQPNPYAGYLGLVLPLALSLLLWSAGRTWRVLLGGPRRLPADMTLRLLGTGLLAVVTLLLGAAIGMSWSRGAWLGLAASTSVVGALRSRRATVMFPVLLSLAGMLVLSPGEQVLPSELAGRLAGLTQYVRYATDPDMALVEITDSNFAVLERVAHWRAAWSMFRDRPWLGVGIGNYAVVYPDYALSPWRVPLGHAHNVFLHFLAETGLLGLVAYTIWLVSATAQSWRLRYASSGFDKAIAVGALGVIAHLTMHSLVDNLYVQGTYLHVAMVLGLLPVVFTRKGLTQ